MRLTLLLFFIVANSLAQLKCENKNKLYYITSGLETDTISSEVIRELRNIINNDTSRIDLPTIDRIDTSTNELAFNRHFDVLDNYFISQGIPKKERDEIFASYYSNLGREFGKNLIIDIVKTNAKKGVEQQLVNIISKYIPLFGVAKQVYKTVDGVVKLITVEERLDKLSDQDRANLARELKEFSERIFYTPTKKINDPNILSFSDDSIYFDKLEQATNRAIFLIKRDNTNPVFIGRHDGTIAANEIIKKFRIEDISTGLTKDDLSRLYNCSANLALDSFIQPSLSEFAITNDLSRYAEINFRSDLPRKAIDETFPNQIVLGAPNEVFFESTSNQPDSIFGDFIIDTAKLHLSNEKIDGTNLSIDSTARSNFIEKLEQITKAVDKLEFSNILLSTINASNLNNIRGTVFPKFLNLPEDQTVLGQYEIIIYDSESTEMMPKCSIKDLTRDDIRNIGTDNNRIKCENVYLPNPFVSQNTGVTVLIKIKDSIIATEKLLYERVPIMETFENELNRYRYDVQNPDNTYFTNNSMSQTLKRVSESKSNPDAIIYPINFNSEIIQSESNDTSLLKIVGLNQNKLFYTAEFPGYEFVKMGKENDCDNEFGFYIKQKNSDVSSANFISDNVKNFPIGQSFSNTAICSNSSIEVNSLNSIIMRNYIVKDSTIIAKKGDQDTFPNSLFDAYSDKDRCLIYEFNKERYLIQNSFINSSVDIVSSDLIGASINKDQIYNYSSDTRIGCVSVENNLSISNLYLFNDSFIQLSDSKIDGNSNLIFGSDIINLNTNNPPLVISSTQLTKTSAKNITLKNSLFTIPFLDKTSLLDFGVSFENSIIENSIISDTSVFDSKINNSRIQGSTLKDGSEVTSESIVKSSVLVGTTSESSTIQNSYLNGGIYIDETVVSVDERDTINNDDSGVN